MGLRATAAADAAAILANVSDFAVPITVTNPAGTSADLVGFSSDISAVIDPNTGQAVSSRHISAVLSLTALGALGIPYCVQSKTAAPWVVEFADLAGTNHVYKVREATPDRALGIVPCILEPYEKLTP